MTSVGDWRRQRLFSPEERQATNLQNYATIERRIGPLGEMMPEGTEKNRLGPRPLRGRTPNSANTSPLNNGINTIARTVYM